MHTCIDIRLHHLLCMNFFVGKGYSDEFVDHFTEILNNLQNKTVYIKVVSGADEICSRCPHLVNGVCDREEVSRKFDERIQRLLEVEPGMVFDWDELIARVKTHLSPQAFHKTCHDCEWKGICEKLLKNAL